MSNSPQQQPTTPPPLVTVLIPIKNGIEFLANSLGSVAAQIDVDLSEVSVLIGINGHPHASTIFDTATRLADIFRYKVRINVIDMGPQCRGKCAALNTMVRDHVDRSTEWVAILDVDDIWMPRKLAAQWRWLTNTDLDCVCVHVIGTRCIYREDGGMQNGIVPDIPTGYLEGDFLDGGNPMINSSAVIRRVLAWWDPAEEGIEDYDMWLRLRRRGAVFYNVVDVLVTHRLHPNSAFNARGNAARVPALIAKHGGRQTRSRQSSSRKNWLMNFISK